MIALYIVAIVVVCGLLAFYFFWTARKSKKHIERLRLEQGRGGLTSTQTQVEADLKQVEKEVAKAEKALEAELEDFVWDSKPEKPAQEEEQDSFDSEFDDAFDESLFESKIDSYEKFLREEHEDYDFDRKEPESEQQNDLDAIMNFDFDRLKGKSRDEVVEMIKDLSPAVQDFILNDIFERKNNED